MSSSFVWLEGSLQPEGPGPPPLFPGLRNGGHRWRVTATAFQSREGRTGQLEASR